MSHKIPVHLQAIASSAVVFLVAAFQLDLSLEEREAAALAIAWCIWASGGLAAWLRDTLRELRARKDAALH